MKTIFATLLFLTLPLFAQTPLPPGQEEPGRPPSTFSEANAQAIYWINLIDQFQFGATWLEAGSLVHDVVTRDQWAAAMKASRQKLGTVSSRRVSSHQRVHLLPGGTRGDFMVIKYETNYSRSPGMVETIVLMSEGNLGLWKVVSYKIEK